MKLQDLAVECPTMPLKLRKFLKNLIDILREDYPQQLHKIIEDAQGITYHQTLDDEKAIIKIQKQDIVITSKAPKKEIKVRVITSRDCLFNILEGKQTLKEAFYLGELDAIGDPLTLLRCYRIWERVISLGRTSPRFFFLTYKLR